MIICICRNIKSSDIPDEKISQKQFEKLTCDMKCGMCLESFKQLMKRKTNEK